MPDKILTAPPAGVVVLNRRPMEEWPEDKVKWSGNEAPPPVGTRLEPLCPYQGVNVGEVIVAGYDVEHGFLYALCLPVSAKGWPRKLKLTCPPYLYVAGVDLLPRKSGA